MVIMNAEKHNTMITAKGVPKMIDVKKAMDSRNNEDGKIESQSDTNESREIHPSTWFEERAKPVIPITKMFMILGNGGVVKPGRGTDNPRGIRADKGLNLFFIASGPSMGNGTELRDILPLTQGLYLLTTQGNSHEGPDRSPPAVALTTDSDRSPAAKEMFNRLEAFLAEVLGRQQSGTVRRVKRKGLRKRMRVSGSRECVESRGSGHQIPGGKRTGGTNSGTRPTRRGRRRKMTGAAAANRAEGGHSGRGQDRQGRSRNPHGPPTSTGKSVGSSRASKQKG
jgi:hypothetical protein